MNTQHEAKLIACQPYYGVGAQDLLRLAAEKDAMVRKFCALRQATDDMENYIACRASAVLLRWDMRNLRPQGWDDETLRRQLWRVCVNARQDYLRRQRARKRTGLAAAPAADEKARAMRIYLRGPRFFCGVLGGGIIETQTNGKESLS